jgi:hypothetical protein
MNHTKRKRETFRFDFGRLVATPGALAAIAESGQCPTDFLSRHLRCDWGDVSKDDAALNDAAVDSGERLLSAYTTLKAQRLWIITEADRSATTILLPDEY